MNHWVEISRTVSFFLVVFIGLCGLSIAAFHVLDRVITIIAKAIGLWPFLRKAVWEYAQSLNAKEKLRDHDAR